MKKFLSVLLVMTLLLACIPLGSIPVFAEAEPETPVVTPEANPVYYTDLFYAYPYYLAEDAYLAQYSAAIENVFANVYESYANSPLVVGTGIEHALDTITSPTEIVKLMTDVLGISDFSYEQALDAANEELLKNLLSTSSLFDVEDSYATCQEIGGKLNKAISIFNGLGFEDENGFELTVEDYVESAFYSLCEAGLLDWVDTDTINQLFIELDATDEFKLSDCFELAETEIEIAQAIIYAVVLEDARIDIVNDILSTQKTNTVLKDGMQRLKTQMTANFVERFIYQYLKNVVADKIWGAVDKAVGTVLGTAQINAIFKLVNIAFNALVDVPKFADVLKWQVLMCYSRDLADGLPVYALTYATNKFTSNKIKKYETLFAAYDAVNNATIALSKEIMNKEDPLYEAYMVLVEARNNGEETVVLKSGKDSVNIPATMSDEDFYSMMRLGLYEAVTESDGLISLILNTSISISNTQTTVKIPRKANTLASIFRKGISDNAVAIETFSNINAYAGHISSVKNTVQNIPVEERNTISKDVYSQWTYTVKDTIRLRHGSDTVYENSIYAVNGYLLGNINIAGTVIAPEEELIVDGNMSVSVAKGAKIYGSLSATGDFSIPYWTSLDIYGNVRANNIDYGYDSVVNIYGTATCNNLNAGGLGTIYGDVTVYRNVTIDHLLTVENGGNLIVGGNVKVVLYGDFTNRGNVEIAGDFSPVYGNEINNYGTLLIRGDVLIVDSLIGTSPHVHLYNWGTMCVHDLNLNSGNSYYSAQSDEALLYVSGDITRRAGSIGGTVIFNGTEKQTTNAWYYSKVILANESEDGVHFTYGYSDFRGLFDHRGNNFTTTSVKFIDYDGDGMKDNLDPEPASGNPCFINFQSEDLTRGSVSMSFIETTGGTKVTVEALPTPQYELKHWIDETGLVVSTATTWTFVARGDATYTAVFQKRSQPITVVVDGGTIATCEKAEIESAVTVTVTEDAGYMYQAGSLAYNGIPIVDNTFVMPDEPVEITATFVRNEYYFALSEAIATAKGYTAELYTTESFAVLSQALSAAEGALHNHITQEESNTHVILLQQAIDGLVERSIVSLDVFQMPNIYINVPSSIDDLILQVTYDNGIIEEVSAGEYTVVGFDAATLGEQTIYLMYEGVEISVDICVVLRNLADCTGFEVENVTFTGKAEEYKQSLTLIYAPTDETLIEGIDYEVIYTNANAIGTATVTVTGKGLYNGTLEATYRISCSHSYSGRCDAGCDKCGTIRDYAWPSHSYPSASDVICVECGMVRASLLSVSNFEDEQLHEMNTYRSATISQLAARTGVYGLYLNGEESGEMASCLVNTVPGRTYDLSLWACKTLGFGVSVQIRDEQGNVLVSQNTKTSLSPQWKKTELSFVAVSEKTHIVLVCTNNSNVGWEQYLYIDDICLTEKAIAGGQTSVSEDVNGLAFKFDVAANGGRVHSGTHYVNSSAEIVPYLGSEPCKLVRMGAVVSNQSDATLDLESVNGGTIIDIEAVYLCELDKTFLSYAVRVINIPAQGMDTEIFVRPYYVYEKDGAEVIVYGDTVSKAYNATLNE